MAARQSSRVGVASAGITVFVLVATWISLQLAKPTPIVPTSAHEAEVLLEKAVRLAQAGDYAGLCQTVALSSATCNVHLQEAELWGLVPGNTKPRVVAITQVREDEVSLRLRGTYANGDSYMTEFVVLRDQGQLRTDTPVYWLPMTRSEPHICTNWPGQVECSGTARAPSG